MGCSWALGRKPCHRALQWAWRPSSSSPYPRGTLTHTALEMKWMWQYSYMPKVGSPYWYENKQIQAFWPFKIKSVRGGIFKAFLLPCRKPNQDLPNLSYHICCLLSICSFNRHLWNPTMYKHILQTGTHFPGGSDGKESACNSRDPGSIPGLGRFPREGKDYSLQYSCLENPIEERWAALWASHISLDFTVKCWSLSHVRLFGIPWTVACQAPLSKYLQSSQRKRLANGWLGFIRTSAWWKEAKRHPREGHLL